MYPLYSGCYCFIHRCSKAVHDPRHTIGTQCTSNALYVASLQYAQRMGAGAPVYLAAVLEYLAAEILELAGDCCANTEMFN